MRLVTTTWLSPLLSKNLHGNTLRHTEDTGILLKTAYFMHFEHFPAIEKLKNKFCCKPLWICVKLVTTTWLSPLLNKKLNGNTLRHTWDTVILLKTAKTAYFKHFKLFQLLKNLKKQNFATNHCEYVWDWSQQLDFHDCWAKNSMGIPWGIPEIQ